jgi:hypothetical protein
LLIIGIVLSMLYVKKEKYFGEYNDACRWDSARRCTLSDGSEGNCALGSRCYPSFSQNRCII